MEIKLLNNEQIEAILRERGFTSLEDLAEQEATDGLATIESIGKVRADMIKEVLWEHGIRCELTNEEKLLIYILSCDWDKKMLAKQFLIAPMTARQENIFYDVLRDKLSSKENAVLELHWGLNGAYERSLSEVAESFHTTTQRIHQIEAKALDELRNPVVIEKLKLAAVFLLSKEEIMSELLAAHMEIENLKMGIPCDVVDWPIERLKLSTRSYNALKKAEIDTVGKIQSVDLEKIPSFGPGCMAEVIKKLCTIY